MPKKLQKYAKKVIQDKRTGAYFPLSTTPSANRTSSENLAKLPSFSEEQYAFFKIVKNGDLVGLQDFMASDAYKKIEINKTDKFGFSALHHAVRRQDEEMVSLFLEQENLLTYDTIFHAIQEENIAITKMLVEYQDKNKQPIVSKFTQSLVSIGVPQRKKSPAEKYLEDFDSQFADYFTAFLLSAQLGNSELMEMFYARGERLESDKEHHNLGCGCKVCLRTDKLLTSSTQRFHLFQALTNPQYICFITGKIKNIDPANYAIEKIKKCLELEGQDNMFEGRYAECAKRLSEFIKDLIDLCRNNDEAQIFFNVPDESTQGRLQGKYPRLWSMVGLKLVDAVAHPHSQYVVFCQWTGQTAPEWNTSYFKNITEVGYRFITLLPFSMFLWLGTDDKVGKYLAQPINRYYNWVASYLIFLGLVIMQMWFPRRCNKYYDIRYNTVAEVDCRERGPPRVGTEWILIAYVLSFYVSMVKRNSIPWFWRSLWTWYEMVTHILFTITFICWGWAWVFHSRQKEDRKLWKQSYPEVIADTIFSLACILAFGRIFRLIEVNQWVGPLQIALGRMIKNFVPTTLVYAIILFSFSIGLNAIYVPYNKLVGYDSENKVDKTQKSPFGVVLSTPEDLFWALYGQSGKEHADIVDFQKPNGGKNVHGWSIKTGKFLMGSYHVIGVLMMFNMLVAYFTAGSDEIMQNADAEWKFARTQVYMTFMKDTRLPPPFCFIPTLRGILRFFHYLRLLCFKDSQTKEKASWSLHQCCFIEEPIYKNEKESQQKKYRLLILQLMHRYKGLTSERASQTPATNDDVNEIGEELAEIKAQIMSKMREMRKQYQASLGQPQSIDTQIPSSKLNQTQSGGPKTLSIFNATAKSIPGSEDSDAGNIMSSSIEQSNVALPVPLSPSPPQASKQSQAIPTLTSTPKLPSPPNSSPVQNISNLQSPAKILSPITSAPAPVASSGKSPAAVTPPMQQSAPQLPPMTPTKLPSPIPTSQSIPLSQSPPQTTPKLTSTPKLPSPPGSSPAQNIPNLPSLPKILSPKTSISAHITPPSSVKNLNDVIPTPPQHSVPQVPPSPPPLPPTPTIDPGLVINELPIIVQPSQPMPSSPISPHLSKQSQEIPKLISPQASRQSQTKLASPKRSSLTQNTSFPKILYPKPYVQSPITSPSSLNDIITYIETSQQTSTITQEVVPQPQMPPPPPLPPPIHPGLSSTELPTAHQSPLKATKKKSA